MMDAIDALAALPGTAQTGEDIVDAEIVPRRNLPVVRKSAGLPAVGEDNAVEQAFGIAAAWTDPPVRFNRWRWASSLADAIRHGDATTFKLLILSALAAGFDGEPPVKPGEFEVALLEVDAARAGAR